MIYINKKRTTKLILKKREIIYLFRRNIKIKRSSNKLNYTKLELFRIKEKLELIIYRLELTKEIRIYSIFYIFLLKLVLDNARLELSYIDKEI